MQSQDLYESSSLRLDSPQVAITLLDPKKDLEEILSLRKKAWTPYASDANLLEHFTQADAWEEKAIHIGVRFLGKLIAAARLSFHANPSDLVYVNHFNHLEIPFKRKYACLSKLVVDPDFSGKGLAKLLDEERLQLAVDYRAEAILAIPVPHRVHTFVKRGFVLLGSTQPNPQLTNRANPVFYLDLESRKIKSSALFLS